MPNLAGITNQRAASKHIRLHGQQLVVERWPSGAQAATLTQSLWAIPQAIPEAADQMLVEGDLNADSVLPHKFVFEGTAALKEAQDMVIYRGWRYRILSIVPTADIAGIVTAWSARTVRESQVTV